MKKITKAFFILFVMGMFTNNLYSQGMYVGINVGYGFCTSAQNIDNDFMSFYNYTAGNNSYTVEQIDVSLGKGLNLGAAFGYMFNKNVGAELGISYLMGGKTEAKDEYDGGMTDYSLSATMLRINPSIIVTTGTDNAVNPYAKFGLIFGMGSVLYEFEDNDDGDVTVMEFKFSEGLAMGLSAAIGADYSLNDNITLFGEIDMVNMSYAPTKGEITKATYNGVDGLPDMTTSEKEFEFVDSYTYNTQNPPPDSQPSQELKYRLPFGSVGVKFGVKINL